MAEPLTLGPPRGPIIFGMVMGVLGCALGIGFVVDDSGLTIFGVVLAVVAALVAFAFGALLRPGTAYLRLDAVGLAYKWGPRAATYGWSDIAAFEVAPTGKNSWGVGIRLQPHHASRSAGAVEGTAGGFDDTIPSYTMTAQALVTLLEERRLRAGASSLGLLQ